jgi:hypothetical protein
MIGHDSTLHTKGTRNHRPPYQSLQAVVSQRGYSPGQVRGCCSRYSGTWCKNYNRGTRSPAHVVTEATHLCRYRDAGCHELSVPMKLAGTSTSKGLAAHKRQDREQ